jgi:hypothetical protein
MRDGHQSQRTSARRKRTGPKPIVDVDIDVTPGTPSGPVVICDLVATPGGNGGSHITDGVIFLDSSEDYRLHLHLKPGSSGQFSWAANAFWSKKSKCPTRSQLTPTSQFPSPPTVTGYTLDVAANGIPGRSAIHFRLNMLDPGGNQLFCDPIIINN